MKTGDAGYYFPSQDEKDPLGDKESDKSFVKVKIGSALGSTVDREVGYDCKIIKIFFGDRIMGFRKNSIAISGIGKDIREEYEIDKKLVIQLAFKFEWRHVRT